MIKIFKKGDIFIIILIIIFSFFPIIFVKNSFNSTSAKIVVSQNSKVIGVYELNPSKNSKYIDFEFELNGKIYKGKLETKNSKVRLLRLPKEAVPKSIHEDMSWIGDDSKIIVALPVKLVVSIENSNEPSDIDSVAT